MPLAIPQQVLSQPVTNYYKGKAMRQELAMSEKKEELLDLNIEAAKNPPVDPKEKRMQEKWEAEQYATAQDGLANAAASAMIAAQENPQLSDQEWTSVFDAALVQNLGEDAAAGMRKVWDKNNNNIIDPEERAKVEAWTLGFGKEIAEGGGDRTPQKFIDKNGNAIQGSMDKQGNYYDSSQKRRTDITPIAPSATQTEISGDPRTGTQRGAAYQEHLGSFNDSSNVQELITDALPRVNALPDAVGIKGKFASGGAGLLTTFGQDEAANRFAEAMSGASAEEIAAIQTQLQVIRSRIIPITTGEESSRISDNEREIANRTVGVIDSIRGPADLTKAYPQVMGAMTQLYVESWANKYNVASQDKFIDYPYDFNSDADVEKLVDEFIDAGIEEQTIKRALTRLAKIQGVSQ